MKPSYWNAESMLQLPLLRCHAPCAKCSFLGCSSPKPVEPGKQGAKSFASGSLDAAGVGGANTVKPQCPEPCIVTLGESTPRVGPRLVHTVRKDLQ